jgi:hypothetical protein
VKLFQNVKFWNSFLKNAVLQGVSLKNRKSQSKTNRVLDWRKYL